MKDLIIMGMVDEVMHIIHLENKHCLEHVRAVLHHVFLFSNLIKKQNVLIQV